ncbi:MAG: hypothetical protein KDC06_09650 [Chitinophagaceae bacterium]|nr:hypothetical protein [Chitinophagaceae bacterium]
MMLTIIVSVIVLIIILLLASYVLNSGETIITKQVIINSRQDTVFDFAADMRNELKWNPDVQSMELLTTEPIGKGTVFLAKWSLSKKIQVEIIHYDRPHSLIFKNGGPLEVRLELNFSMQQNQTQMATKFIAQPHGFLRVIFPLLKRKLSSQESMNMVNFKKELEGNHAIK